MQNVTQLPRDDNPPRAKALTPADAYAVRCSRLRRGLRAISTQQRLRDCAMKKCRAEFGVWVESANGKRKATAKGLLTCNSVHVCPVCARKIRARRTDQLARALRGALDAHPSDHWQMLSVTLRHRAGMALKWLRLGLMAAWRHCRQSGSVQRIFKKHVRATARALEVTHSFANGWHPHLHVALFTSDWSGDEQNALDRQWQKSVVHALTHVVADDRKRKAKTTEGYHVTLEERALALECRPMTEHAIKWSAKKLFAGDTSTQLEKYMTDIGLELTLGPTKTTQRDGARTPWQIAQAAVDGDKISERLWCSYERALKGARCIELTIARCSSRINSRRRKATSRARSMTKECGRTKASRHPPTSNAKRCTSSLSPRCWTSCARTSTWIIAPRSCG